jgi:hypothetical protein
MPSGTISRISAKPKMMASPNVRRKVERCLQVRDEEVAAAERERAEYCESVAEAVGELAADDRGPVDGVGRGLETALDGLAAAPHPFAEDGEPVDGVVHGLAEEGEEEEQRDDQEIAGDRADPRRGQLRIEAHVLALPAPVSVSRPSSLERSQERRKGGAHVDILWILLIVILVLALLGFFSRGYW